MWTVSLESDDNLLSIAQKLHEAAATEVGLPLSTAFPFTQNLVNLKILREEAERLGKKLVFLPQDEASRELALSLANGGQSQKGAFGFVVGQELSEELAAKTRPAAGVKRLKEWVFLGVVGLGRWSRGFYREGLARWGLGMGLLLLLGGGLVFWGLGGFWPQANLILTVGAEALVKSIDVEASLTAEKTEVKTRTIPAVKIVAALKGKSEGSASGKKEVGEKATGMVTIYNKTGQEQSLKKGTILRKAITVEPGQDLAYLLNSDLKVAAREEREGGYDFGKAAAAVTAEKFGDAYNLPAGTTFSVGSFSSDDLAARNEPAFAGGSQRVVKVVTKEDQEKTEAQLRAALQEKLKAELRSRLVGDQKLEEGVTAFTTLKKAYDRPVDEEAEKFNLELEEEATAYVYSQGELQSLLTAVLAELVPANYELSDAEQSLTIANVAASPTSSRELPAGILKFTAKVRGYIVPKLDVAKIKKDLAGKSLKEAESYLNSLAGVDAHTLTLWPNLPFLQRLPRFPGRLEVSVERK